MAYQLFSIPKCRCAETLTKPSKIKRTKLTVWINVNKKKMYWICAICMENIKVFLLVSSANKMCCINDHVGVNLYLGN